MSGLAWSHERSAAPWGSATPAAVTVGGRDCTAARARYGRPTRSAASRLATTIQREDSADPPSVLRLIPNLRTLMLHVGTNFAPEHLEDMFASPRPDLSRLELRFRPYVEEANYYQFLKGSYFDKALHTLQTWPETPSFRYLSLVQDLLPRKHLPIPRTRAASARDVLTPSAGDSEGGAGTGESGVDGDGTEGGEGGETELESDLEYLSLGPSEEGTPALTPARGTPGTVTPAAMSGAQTPADPPKDRGYTGQGMFPYLSHKLQSAKPKTFAQPIVFFDVRCVAFLGQSPVARHLTHFRLRVPSRDIAYVLVTKPEPLAPIAFSTNAPPPTAANAPLYPALTYLDISTTNVRLDAVLATLLRNYELLEHLVLDRTNLFGFRSRDKGEMLSRELGGLCVTVCLQRAKEREKALGAWDARQRTATYLRDQRAAEASRAQAATRGLSAAERAELDLQRAEEEEAARQAQYARARRGHRSAGQSTISLRAGSRRNQALAATSGVNPADLPPSNRAWFVLPALPRLKSVNIGGEAVGISKFYDLGIWRQAFRDGWVESTQRNLGWARNTADKYARARKKVAEWQAYTGSLNDNKKQQTSKKGKASAKTQPPLDVRLFRYPLPGEVVPRPDYEDKEAAESEEHALAGLIEIDDAGAAEYIAAYKEYLGDCERIGGFPCVFCLTPDCEGPYRRGGEGERVDGRGGMDGPHEPGCGHLLGRRIWGWEGVE